MKETSETEDAIAPRPRPHADDGPSKPPIGSAAPFKLEFPMDPQPSDDSCGPACLRALYQYYGRSADISDLIRDIPQLTTGGTLAVHLGIDALRRGFQARLHTHNLRIFDPTWFSGDSRRLDGFREKLESQTRVRPNEKTRMAAKAYLKFHDLGGDIRMGDLNAQLIRKALAKGHPILVGLSSTYLYRTAREIPESNDHDDIHGDPVGHFVVLTGYDRATRLVMVADPYEENPLSHDHSYTVAMDRLLNAILLGVLTYDGNLLVIQPKS